MCNIIGSRLCTPGDHYVLVGPGINQEQQQQQQQQQQVFQCQRAKKQGVEHICAHPLKIQVHTPGWPCYDCWLKAATSGMPAEEEEEGEKERDGNASTATIVRSK